MLPGQVKADERRLAEALARVAFAENRVRVATLDIGDCIALVSCGFGVYGITRDGQSRRILFGRFHGISHQGDHVLLLEICDRPRNPGRMARILRLPLSGDRLGEPEIVVRGLDNKAHQLAQFDGLIHLVDTANQQIQRFTPDGVLVDEIRSFPFRRGDPAGGDYHHLNSIALVGDRIGVMLHNGKLKRPDGTDRPSEVAWFDRDWRLIARHEVAGHGCHDIVADEHGTVWHCGSMDGEIVSAAGERHKVTQLMTRGLAFAADRLFVGASVFGDRATRDMFMGQVLVLDRGLRPLATVELPSAPMDLIAL
jgi:hypothetical protein